jgi:hypothetical protein
VNSSHKPIALLEIGALTSTGFSSGAYRCLGEDGRYYYVKSPRLAGSKAVISEWLAAGLAERMQLPVRESAMVQIPALLITPELRRLGSGLAFGSLELAHADDLSCAAAARVPAPLQAELFLFDYWIQNADRVLGPAGGNPNLLVANGQPMAVIDHGNAFDPSFSPEAFCNNHAFAGSRVQWLEIDRRQAWEAKALAAADRLSELWESIPQEWHENPHGEILHEMTLENVSRLLHRFGADPTRFWSPLLP